MKLRVYNMINFRRPIDYYDVTSIGEAVKLIDDLANAQLKNKAILDNLFGMEYYNEDESEWYEWYDDEGYIIDKYIIVNGVAVLDEFA